MKTIAIGDIFTKAEIDKATEIYHQCESAGERFSGRCAKEVLEPIMARINETTGQENDQLYFAYMLEYAIRSASSGWKARS